MYRGFLRVLDDLMPLDSIQSHLTLKINLWTA